MKNNQRYLKKIKKLAELNTGNLRINKALKLENRKLNRFAKNCNNLLDEKDFNKWV